MGLQLTRAEMAELVPDSTLWADGDAGRWISDVGTFAALIGYAEWLWPDFEVYDDCVFRRGAIGAENYREWMDRFGGDRAAVERMCNHIDLIYLIQNPQAEDATDPQITYIGRLLRETWGAKLARDFPDRRFDVRFFEDPNDPDDQPLVTFSQIRDA